MTTPTDTKSAPTAATYLSDQLGGKRDYWITWLANDRRPGRAHLIPPLDGPGRPLYLVAALDAFIDLERAKRLEKTGPSGRAAEVMQAFGIGSEDGSRTGRKLACQVTGQLDEQTSQGFVQLSIASPFLIFRLDTDQARSLARSLIQEADDADHMQGIVTRGAAA